ncbi:GL15894 [Drosophila persimilis]|uniref:HIG1 domain family member 2A, mitochondrial n=2 Tax=pseudoobscura subgroup TaxID=32358 RepID=A0A6I8W7E3_DROPS|nr:HIG1 domain family member 2A, mitochondrial [Drosophila pseudoobscura]XP_002024484.1 HIG1 domain family member 2A, mitochondrial [Drosophila persimilis]XP_017156004.1 HIG1 domain family member 2A, mitochondrial [Drosophila miranda]XP_033239283.1 HIG1 domain family member 2A, mitochondrial [Drosophila pseudoobscura]EDW29925.1 GL15894 [Drosophila persimilis]
MSSKAQITLPEEELDWIQLRQDLGPVIEVETTKEKLQRKIKENPLVPIGCLATTAALTMGLYNFRTGNRKMSQLMMRTRIAAQGFTVAALIIGVVMTYGEKKTP